MKEKLVQFSLQQEAGAFRNDIGKEPQKPRPKLKTMYIITEDICFAYNPM